MVVSVWGKGRDCENDEFVNVPHFGGCVLWYVLEVNMFLYYLLLCAQTSQ